MNILKHVLKHHFYPSGFYSRLSTVNRPLGIVRPLRAHTRIKPAQRDTREMREVCVSRYWEEREEEGSGSILGALGGGWEPHLMMATLTRVNCCSALLIKDSQIILAPGHGAAFSCWGKKGAIWPQSSDSSPPLSIYHLSIYHQFLWIKINLYFFQRKHPSIFR